MRELPTLALVVALAVRRALASLVGDLSLIHIFRTARRGKKISTMREVNESMERVIAGPERKGRVMDEVTKHTIAYHESGHALVGCLLYTSRCV